MKRLRRWVLNAMTTVSVLLCVWMTACSVLSYWIADQWAWASRQRAIGICIADGTVCAFSATRFMGQFPVTGPRHRTFVIDSSAGHWGGLVALGGTASQVALGEDGGSLWSGFVVGAWQLAIAFAILALARFISPKGWRNVARASLGALAVLSFFWWVPTVSFAIILALGVEHYITHARVLERQRRLAKGLCLSCGYDLRATPDLCPECGTAASAQVL